MMPNDGARLVGEARNSEAARNPPAINEAKTATASASLKVLRTSAAENASPAPTKPMHRRFQFNRWQAAVGLQHRDKHLNGIFEQFLKNS